MTRLLQPLFDLYNKYLTYYLLLSSVMFIYILSVPISDSELEYSIYYEPNSNLPLRVTSIENSLVESTDDQSSTKTHFIRKLGYRSNGCNCNGPICGCCLGLNLPQFNFNREGCMNFTYDPQEFAVTMDMYFNNDNIYTNTISARNPPPLCIPVVIPYLPATVDFCAKLFDIRMPADNQLHMCFDFETRLQMAPVLVLHFDCMQMGDGGLMLLKPQQEGTQPESSTDSQVDTDVYDEVTEIKYRNSTDVL